jgi:hypothetical protein
MKSISIPILGLALLAATPSSARAPARAEPRTEQGVLAADDDWLAAERRGDVAALDRRLSDQYQDVEADGRAHPKSELIDMTAHRATPATGSPAEVAAEFRRQHPVIEKVVIVGDTAILSFHSVDPSKQTLVLSVDVFSYQDGVWKGVLSKHSGMPT